MILSAVFFAVAALGGLVMLGLRLSGRGRPPMALALFHGGFAATGLVTLAIVVIFQAMAANFAVVALAGFVLAAFGGFALFSFHLRKKDLPIPLMLVHALFAVASFGFLIAALLG